MTNFIPRMVVAGTNSGVGKTTVVVAIVRALAAKGLRVAVFKCGPDYLDPTYHARAASRASHNLDGWMMGKDAVLATFQRASADADIAVIEGVMGLFDGASPTSEEGSTAEIAKWLGAPVVLVVDASGMARSVAAMVQGFAQFDRAVDVAGVICNRIGSRGHLDLLRAACNAPPIFGGFPKRADLLFPERHLGLFTADETAVPEAKLDAWGKEAAAWLDLDAIVACARAAREPEHARDPRGDFFLTAPSPTALGLTAPSPAAPFSAPSAPALLEKAPTAEARCRIALAWDEAFHFYYEDNLARLEALGATIVRFSPIHDGALPDADGIYLGGGYPEAHAAALSNNTAMRDSIAKFAASGGPIYAECGGLMYLSRAIVDREQRAHPMVGIVPAETIMQGKLAALGYVEIETRVPTILGPAGLAFRGHQFRYSELGPIAAPVVHAYSARKRRNGETSEEGFVSENVLASYVHAHFASNPAAASGFVASCEAFRARRQKAAPCK
ncbi:MAG: cobyrinate a,c-diamide synthase [Polyangiaceae bacterium]